MYDFSFVKPGTVADAVTALASEDAQAPVSYTHLTLPTIYSV